MFNFVPKPSELISTPSPQINFKGAKFNCEMKFESETRTCLTRAKRQLISLDMVMRKFNGEIPLLLVIPQTRKKKQNLLMWDIDQLKP